MGEIGVIKLLDKIIQLIRINNFGKAKENFSQLLKIKVKISPKIRRKIYDLGEVFSYTNVLYYIDLVNSHLKKKNNYFLRLIRQELMYNCDTLPLKKLFKVNDIDLRKFSNNPEFLNFRAILYLDDENYDEALKYIGIVLDIEPQNVDFIRTKSLILIEMKRYQEARKLIQFALGVEPDYEKLFADKEFIDTKEDFDHQEKRINKIEKEIEVNANFIKNIKFDFIAISGIFVVILTIVIRVITFDYEGFKELGFFEIIKYQLAINSPWLISLIILFILLLIISSKNNKK